MAVNGKRESLRYENLILAIILAALATPIVKWLVMTVYAALVVVFGQITWFRAITSLSSGIVSAWSTLTPILGILFAYLLLHEVPDMSQWTAAAVILAGMAISQIKPGQSVAIPRLVEKGLVGA